MPESTRAKSLDLVVTTTRSFLESVPNLDVTFVNGLFSIGLDLSVSRISIALRDKSVTIVWAPTFTEDILKPTVGGRRSLILY